MNDLSKEKTITIKEVAEVLGVSIELITKKIRELFPDKMENGKTTYLNEAEVTAVNLTIKQNPYLVQSYEVKTKLEKALLIKQALQFQEEMIIELQSENQELKSVVKDMTPKALEYDTFINNDNTQKIGDVAKILGIKPNTLHQMLRDAKILKKNYVPYAEYEQYFNTVESSTRGGFNVFTSYINSRGVSYIAKRFNLVKKDDTRI